MRRNANLDIVIQPAQATDDPTQVGPVDVVILGIRSTAGVIGWRDVSDLSGANSSDAAKQKTEGAANDSNAANASDGLAW